MISDYFEAPWLLDQMRGSCVGPYIDGFTSALAEVGFSAEAIRKYTRTAIHIGRWADRRGFSLASWNDDTVDSFRRHLSHCRCKRNKGVFSCSASAAEQFLSYLREKGVIAPAMPAPPVPQFAAISEQFADWMLQHRGVTHSTAHLYQVALRPFLAKLGENPATYATKSIRSFVIEQLERAGRGRTRSTVKAIRGFLRFLVAQGRVPTWFEHCVPTVPAWRLASLPRYLEAPDVEHVLKSCDLTTGHGLRDHAVLLLLARLGLRAGDAVGMMLSDIDWRAGTLRVRGKGRREVLLPLPQDVGDAVLKYLERGRPRSASGRMFLTLHAPTRPFATSTAVSDIVHAALKRADIHNPPTRGAHLLRHSAATAMIRAGGSLDTIATVLRHQSMDTTAHYAKVDVAMLQQVAQPWPGGAPC